MCLSLLIYRRQEQREQWKESGDKGTGSRRTGYRKWEVLDPSLPTLGGCVEVMVGWKIVFLVSRYRVKGLAVQETY